MYQFDLVKYATHALVGYGGMLAYDVFVEGRDYNGGFAMKDAMTFGISSLISSLTCEVLCSFVPYLNEGNLHGYIVNPVLSGVIYLILYDYMVAPTYVGVRDSSTNFFVSSVLTLLVSYVENPIASLFGLKHY